MNKSDLNNAFKTQAGITRNEAERVVDIFFESIKNALIEDERVEIRGFGSFKVNRYKPYTGRNPKTGALITIPSKKLPFFKTGKALKVRVDGYKY